MDETTKKIFEEIDKIIESSMSSSPIRFCESTFLIKYEEIKGKYL